MALFKTKQGRKQRLRAYIAPNHIKRRRLGAPLSKELRKKTGKRSAMVHKGDEVVVLSGERKKTRGKVSKADISTSRVYIEGVAIKTGKGREIPVGFQASSLLIITLADRKKKAKAPKATPVQKAAPVPKPAQPAATKA